MEKIKEMNLKEISEIAGFDVSSYVETAKQGSSRPIKHNGWGFWLLGEEDDGFFYGDVWVYAPDGKRYRVLDTAVCYPL